MMTGMHPPLNAGLVLPDAAITAVVLTHIAELDDASVINFVTKVFCRDSIRMAEQGILQCLVLSMRCRLKNCMDLCVEHRHLP